MLLESYIYNMCGCLFFAWFLIYWTDILNIPTEKGFALA